MGHLGFVVTPPAEFWGFRRFAQRAQHTFGKEHALRAKKITNALRIIPWLRGFPGYVVLGSEP